MNDFDSNSRVNKYDKRRKNTKAISILLVIGSILIVVLLGIWMFGGGDEEADKPESQREQENQEEQAENDEFGNNGNNPQEDDDASGDEQNDSDEENNDETNEDNDNEEEKDDSIPSEDVDLEEIDDPDDDNVEKAYKGDWEPIGTSQSEPHEIQYDKESEDWEEMKEAMKYATGLTDMETQWIGSGDNEQEAVGTVSDSDLTEIYRVSIEWQENEGYKPTKVEILNEVDID